MVGTMLVDVVAETTSTPAVVSTFAADPTHAPEWYPNLRSVTWKAPPPASLGSRMEFKAQYLGRRLIYTYEIVVVVPGERLVMRTADGPFPMESTHVESVRGSAEIVIAALHPSVLSLDPDHATHPPRE